MQIRLVELLVAWYHAPVRLALYVVVGFFIASIMLIILLVEFGIELPRREGGIEGELFLFCCGLGGIVLLSIRPLAERAFRSLDKEYLKRTGLDEKVLVEHLVQEAKRQAVLSFTDAPSAASVTMFHYSEEQRVEAYKRFEAEFLERFAHEERRLKFKAYVARWFGLRIPYR